MQEENLLTLKLLLFITLTLMSQKSVYLSIYLLLHKTCYKHATMNGDSIEIAIVSVYCYLSAHVFDPLFYLYSVKYPFDLSAVFLPPLSESITSRR